ncbi:MAG: nucleotidyltransferase family protein [Saprospiraceae bacterium]|nr:nucleotidyltransferase family protein [Saprospiraceae bacterium]MCB9325207.1 nucleotidyltransferase family protein [Lewinellaceae bacterium]
MDVTNKIYKQEFIDQLRKNKTRLFKKYSIKELAIFGSVSRNDFNETSDIDILVDFNRNIGIEFIDLAEELEAILHKKVDLVSRNGVKEKYYQFIKPDLEYV